MLAIPNVMVRGMFLGPDIMAPIQPGDLNRQAVYVNAYACLKELNAFYLLQRRDASSSLLRMEYYDYGENEDLEAEVMESRQMYQAIAPSMKSVLQCLICFNLPFTIVKGLIAVVICMLIYKPLSPVLKGRLSEY